MPRKLAHGNTSNYVKYLEVKQYIRSEERKAGIMEGQQLEFKWLPSENGFTISLNKGVVFKTEAIATRNGIKFQGFDTEKHSHFVRDNLKEKLPKTIDIYASVKPEPQKFNLWGFTFSWPFCTHQPFKGTGKNAGFEGLRTSWKIKFKGDVSALSGKVLWETLNETAKGRNGLPEYEELDSAAAAVKTYGHLVIPEVKKQPAPVKAAVVVPTATNVVKLPEKKETAIAPKTIEAQKTAANNAVKTVA